MWERVPKAKEDEEHKRLTSEETRWALHVIVRRTLTSKHGHSGAFGTCMLRKR